jgi:hypothetical protein
MIRTEQQQKSRESFTSSLQNLQKRILVVASPSYTHFSQETAVRLHKLLNPETLRPHLMTMQLIERAISRMKDPKSEHLVPEDMSFFINNIEDLARNIGLTLIDMGIFFDYSFPTLEEQDHSLPT